MNANISFISQHTFVDALDMLPVPAASFLPDWYKECPVILNNELSKPRTKCCVFNDSTNYPNTTVKNCTPFMDSVTAGYIFKLPLDVQFTYTKTGFIEYGIRAAGSVLNSVEDTVNFQLISTHHNAQHPGLPNLNPSNNAVSLVFKFNPNISIKTPPGYSTFYTHPVNRFDLPFKVYSGVVDTDLYSDIPVQFPFQILYKFKHEDDILIIPRGTPICQVMPFKRVNWCMKTVKFSRECSLKARLHYFAKIINAYKSRYWTKKIYR